MEKIEEFWYCVSPQENLPLYIKEEDIDLVSESLINFLEFIKNYQESSQVHSTFENLLQEALLEDPDIVEYLRMTLGVSNKRFYLDMTYILHNTTVDGKRLVVDSRSELKRKSTAFILGKLRKGPLTREYAEVISKYFIDKGLELVINTLASLNKEQITAVFNNLIAPKETQQREAKLRGHGAEQAFAVIFNQLGASATPADKHLEPMASGDPNVDLSIMQITQRDADDSNIHSFDLVVKDEEGNIRILVQSLIHSSDPGQFGVDKSNETVTIKNLINKYNVEHNTNILLVGCVDGVGYSENPNGTINKLLANFDDFFQINTLFKIAPIMVKAGLKVDIKGISLSKDFFDEDIIDFLNDSYIKPFDIELLEQTTDLSIDAGKGRIIL